MCLRNFGYITTGEEKMIKTITLSMCLAASLLSLNARAQDARAQNTLTRDALVQNDRQYTDGPVTEVDYRGIEGEYVARKVIGSTEFQNKKRVQRSEYRKVLGIELILEIILK